MTTRAGGGRARRWRRRCCWPFRSGSALGALLAAAPAAAQNHPRPETGAHVQVWAPNRLSGTLQRVTPTTLTLTAADSGSVAIPLSDLRELWVESGTRGYFGRGAMLGFVGGLALGGQKGAVFGAAFGGLLASAFRRPAWVRSSLREIRPTPLPGTWVRITTDRRRAEGTIREFGADSVHWDVDGRSRSTARSAIENLEWPIGRDRLGRGGFLVGAGIGGGGGALLGLAIAGACADSDHFFCGGGSEESVIAFGLLGAGVGGLLGVAIGQGLVRTRWESDRPEPARVALTPLVTPHRIGFAATLRF